MRQATPAGLGEAREGGSESQGGSACLALTAGASCLLGEGLCLVSSLAQPPARTAVRPSAIGTVCQVTREALLSPEGCPVLTAPRSPLPRRWLVVGGRACSSATSPLPERVASTAHGLSCVKHLSGT